MLRRPPQQQERALPSAYGFALFLIRIVAPFILALLIRLGFRSCVMAPVPLKGDSSFRERRGAALARRRLVFPLFFGGFGTLTQHRVQKPDIPFF